MNMRGFEEASENAQKVLINKTPDVICPVVSPEGLMLLKLIAWMDRPIELRGRDANDIRYLLNTYYTIKNIREEIYNEAHISYMDLYGWNPDLLHVV